MRRLLVAFSAILAAACGSANSPTSPALGDPALASSSGAVIAGTVAGAGSAALFNTTSSAAGMTVAIEGTPRTTTVNGVGQFMLTDVAPGSITLRFSGAGASNATASVGTVAAGETLEVTVAVSGSTAEVTGQVRGNGSEIEGRVEKIEGTTLIVAGRTVTTNASTEIRNAETEAPATFSQIAVGMRVHVRGTPSGSGETATTAASLILVQNTNTAVPVQLDGAVSDLEGTAAAFTFRIGSREVRGTGSTEFAGGPMPQFAGLADGVAVHVSGQQENGWVQASRIVLKGGGKPQPGTTWTGSGAAAGISGACPSISFTLKGLTVRSSASTAFSGVTCATLKNGTGVTATGTTQADGSVLATSIAKN